MKRVLIVGATSAIAQASARVFAARGDQLFLVARNEAKLGAVAQDLRARGAEVSSAVADLNAFDRHGALLEEAVRALGGLDVVLIAHGTLSDQGACERDYLEAERELRTNFLSVVSLLTPLANRFEKQRGGTIAVISSVAGDRGRGSNYVYGTAKGALSIFLQGLRNRLHPYGVRVVTLKPGFVDTPMTAGVKKNALFATPETVGQGIVRAIDGGSGVVYLPAFWRWIMMLVRAVPEPLFKRLKL